MNGYGFRWAGVFYAYDTFDGAMTAAMFAVGMGDESASADVFVYPVYEGIPRGGPRGVVTTYGSGQCAY